MSGRKHKPGIGWRIREEKEKGNSRKRQKKEGEVDQIRKGEFDHGSLKSGTFVGRNT